MKGVNSIDKTLIIILLIAVVLLGSIGVGGDCLLKDDVEIYIDDSDDIEGAPLVDNTDSSYEIFGQTEINHDNLKLVGFYAMLIVSVILILFAIYKTVHKKDEYEW